MPSASDPTAAQQAANLELRINCLARHYTFFRSMLTCASYALQHLMDADPGCFGDDVSNNRYGCLCRRRTKYLIIDSVPDPTILGKTAQDVITSAVVTRSGARVDVCAVE